MNKENLGLYLKSSNIISFLGFLTSLILLGLSIALITIGTYEKITFIETEAVVKTIVNESDERRYIIVEYDVAGVKYEAEYPYWNSELDNGDVVTISYNPKNPEEISARGTGYIITFVILLVIGLPFLLSILFKYNNTKKEKRRILDLISKNQKIDAKVVCIEERTNVESFGTSPIEITAEFDFEDEDTGLTKHFILTSELIWVKYDLSFYVDKTVSIYYSDKEFKNYFIDYRTLR